MEKIDAYEAKKAVDVLTLFESFRAPAINYYQRVSQDISFNIPGGQWKADQVAYLESKQQAALEIPIIKPQIQLQKSQIIGNNPAFKVIPRTDTDIKKAKAMNELLQFVWFQNNGNYVTDEVVTYQLMCGKGYYHIWYHPFADDGYGQIIIDFLHPLNVVPDPNSRRRDEEDSAAKFIYKYIDKSEAIRIAPQHKDYIEKFCDAEESFYSPGDLDNVQGIEVFDAISRGDGNTILLAEMQKKVLVPAYIVYYKNGKNEMVRSFAESEYNRLKAKIKVDPQAATIYQAIVRVEKSWKERVQRTVVLGERIIQDEILPTDKYTIIPVCYEHYGNPYTISLTSIMKGLQQETNYRRSLMIAYATASVGNKLLMPKGSVDDQDEFEASWGRPDAVLWYEPDEYGHPVPVGPVPLPNALFAMDGLNKQDAQYVAGSFGLSHGDASQAPETKGATILLDQWAGRRIGVVAKNLYYAIDQLGRVAIDFIQAKYTKPRIFRLLNPYSESESEMVSVGIGDDYDDETIVSLKDPSVGRYDVVTMVGSMAPTNRYAEVELYLSLLREKAIDQIEFLKKTDVADKEGVLKRMNRVAELEQAVNQLSEKLQLADTEKQSLLKQIESMKIAIEAMRASVSMEKSKLKYESKKEDELLDLDKAIQEYEIAKQKLSAGEEKESS